MADILENVLSDQISTSDLIEWLRSNHSELADLQSVNNSEFIPYFINYLKENCSWLLTRTEKSSDGVIIDKGTNQSNHPLPNSKQIFPQREKRACDKSTHYHTVHKGIATNGFESKGQTKGINEKHTFSRENITKKPQIISFGCTPYQQKRKEGIQKSKPPKGNVQSFSAASSQDSLSSRTDISNLDAFPPLGAKVEDAKVRRRITPTPVQSANSGSLKFGKSHFPLPSNKVASELFRSSPFQDEGADLQSERDLLKQARDKFSKVAPVPVLQNGTKPIDVKVCNPKESPDVYTFPDPENVTTLNGILKLSKIYAFLLDNALVPNVTSEVYFLFELITSKVALKDKQKEDSIFNSIHNCIYFAVSVLGQNGSLLYMLDNTTLASLAEIPYLLKFSPQLVSFLQLCCSVKHDLAVSLPSLTRVPFQLDDDSRINFPDEHTFISFKKQRDLFYELLREWQEQPLEYVDSKYHEKFARKARSLISLGSSAVNMHHLARLFQSQLIASCMCLEVNEVYDELLNDIQKNFPGKFKKLQERFLMPSRVGGLTPPPSFYGIQAFFSELIVAAASPSLNQHLINIFVSKILELDNTDILSEGELSSLVTLKDKYNVLLHTLRLLGKFLGYLHFLPYSMSGPIPLHLVDCHLKSRKLSIPPLDLTKSLQKAVKNNHILLTVPWIVEYLSLMDPMAQHLEHIQEALNILLDIYRWKNFPSEDPQSILFLRLIIGWLFEVSHFQKRYYLLLKPVSFQYPSKVKGVDALAIIDKQLIHSCCPYLIEFKVLIFNFLHDIRNKREVRKITPFSTKQVGTSSLTTKQQLESELEENFFFLHPPSMKKTCDFIAERMASKAIGKIRLEVTNAKLSIVKDIVNTSEYKMIRTSSDPLHIKQQQIVKLLDASILSMYDSIRYKVRDLIENIRNDINNVIPLLLSDDIKPSVIDICCKISFRMGANKVTDWCDSNLLLDAMKSDIKSKVNHLFKGECDTASGNSVNYSHWISLWRRTVVRIHSRCDDSTLESLLNCCSKMAEHIAEDSPKTLKRMIVSLSVDLFIALVVHYPEKCENLIEEFIKLWSSCSKDMLPIELFLCPQNVKFLQTSGNFEFSCEKYVYVMKCLLDIEVFDVKDVQRCLKGVNELDWQGATLRETLKNFTEVLSS